MILPAIGLVLAVGLGAAQLGVVQVRLTDAAADAARMLGRGEGPGAASARISQAQPAAAMAIAHSGELVCVTASAQPSLGLLGALFAVSGTGCALDDADDADDVGGAESG
ncbi:TadE family type IV pilus minor pilin [Herbiconiux sp. 11R-BC]